MNNKPTDRLNEMRSHRLLKPMALRLIALVLILALVALFPARQLMNLGHNDDTLPSSISIFYSRALLQASPEDRVLRLSLSRKLMSIGEFDAARDTLTPLDEDSSLATQRLLLELDWQSYTTSSKSEALHTQHRATLETRLENVQANPELPSNVIATLAMYWLALGEPAQAALLYERLAAQDPVNRYQWLSLAGQWWLKAGNPERSAKTWHKAFEAAEALPQASLLTWFVSSAVAETDSRRQAALAALNAAQQSQGESALTYARQFIAFYPSDPEFLDIGIKIALSRNHSQQALEWSHRYLENKPDDLQALERHANIALAAGQPAEAATFFERLAEQDPDNRYHWLSLAGEWWLKAGNPERSAKAWHDAFEAVEDEPSPDLGLIGWLFPLAYAIEEAAPLRRRDAALASLQAARQSLSAEAMTYAQEYVNHYPQDAEILHEATQVALALGDAEQAMAWSRRYLELNPENLQALESHVDVALALGDVKAAANALLRLVQQVPDNPEYRQRLAQVHRWAGQPQEALAQYEYLATQTDSGEYDAQVIDIAQSIYDRQATLAALLRIAARHSLDDQQRRLLVDLYYDLGEPEQAIAQIQDWIDRGSTTRDLWVRMATWQEQTGQLEEALASWDRLAQRFGHDLQETQARSLLQAKLWRLPQAMTTLQALNPPTTSGSETHEYWKMLGELSWLLLESETSLNAYRQLYHAGALDEANYFRLIQSAAEAGNIELAMQVVREDWPTRRQPELVLQMLDTAQRQHRPDLIHEIFELTRNDHEAFSDSVSYWWLYAEQQLARHDIDGARRSYLKALSLAPDDTNLRAALLYTLVQAQRDDELRRHLAQWSASAQGSAQLMAAIATGHGKLGNERLALVWYDRAVRANPENYFLMLDYADALERNRRFDSARRWRQHALLEVRPRLKAQLESDLPMTPERKREAARLLAVQTGLLGLDSSRDWLQAVSTHSPSSAAGETNQDWLFDSHMIQQQPAYARHEYLRAQLQRQSRPLWQQLAVALQRNDHRTLQRLLANDDSRLNTSDRIETLTRLGYTERALVLSLAHTTDAKTYLYRAAELSNQLPNRAGVQVSAAEVGDLDIVAGSTYVQMSREKHSLQVEVGQRHLSDRGLYAEVDGLRDERFAQLTLLRRQRRGQTALTLGTLDTDAENILQLSAQQHWQFTSRVRGSLFTDYNALSRETDLLRILGTRDQLGAAVDWRLTSRDSVKVTGAYTQFHSREERNKLADGYRLEASVSHTLSRGPTHQAQLHLLSSTEHNTLVEDMPDDIATRLPADTDRDNLIPERYSFLGAGLTLSRGEPGSPYPLVASPRYQFGLATGYAMPDDQIGVNARFSIGTSLLGSDELSLHLGIDQSGGSPRSNAYNATLNYQFFLGR